MGSTFYVIMEKNIEMKVKKLFHTYFQPGIILSFIGNIFTVHSNRIVACLPDYSAIFNTNIFSASSLLFLCKITISSCILSQFIGWKCIHQS